MAIRRPPAPFVPPHRGGARVRWMLGIWAICALSFGIVRGAAAADPQSPNGAVSSGPGVGAIAAGCVGVLFGALLARWQIKSMQKRRGG